MANTPCRSCGAQMIWAITETGKKMPVDAEPSSAGEFVLFWIESENTPQVRSLVSIERNGRPMGEWDGNYSSHFATCPNAGQHRSKNQQKGSTDG